MSRQPLNHDNGAFDEVTGRDSFLDVVANIVAVLILLVILVGLRASFSGESEPQSPDVPTEKLAANPEQIEQVYEDALTEREELAGLIEKTAHVRQAMLAGEEERNRLKNYVSAFAEEIEKRRANLDQQKMQDEQLQRQIAEAQQTLDELTREQVSLMSSDGAVKEIVNTPPAILSAPNARRVHLRMSQNHVGIVPVEQALSEIVADLKNNQDHLHDRFTNTIGPIGGFWVRYRVTQREVARRGPDGVMGRGTATAFDGAQFTPASEPYGEPIDAALEDNSEMMLYLYTLDPASTSVVVTLYTDSFDDFHQLKEKLHRMGFSPAVHTRQEGELFSVSPRGQSSDDQ